MFDIYAVTPGSDGELDKVLIAGKYEDWGTVIFAMQRLFGIAINTTLPTLPAFEVQICHHRVKSNHYRTFITHTAPTLEEDLRELLLTK